MGTIYARLNEQQNKIEKLEKGSGERGKPSANGYRLGLPIMIITDTVGLKYFPVQERGPRSI